MSTIIRVLLAFARITAAELISRANAIYAGMNLNPAYPNPPVPMPEFRLAIDEFSAANTEAFDGGTKAIAQRNAKREVLLRMLRKLGHYVEGHCNDDVNTLLSSGFQAAQTVAVKRPPLSESIRSVDPGPISGQLSVVLVSVPGAASYELRWAQVSGGVPGDWVTKPVVRLRPATPVKALIPGATYLLQARALTPTGFTNWSDSVTRICT